METLELKQRFVELRAKGYSYEKISRELGKAKQTLIDWGKELSEEVANRKALELEALYEEYGLTIQARLQGYGTLLKRIAAEIASRDLADVPTGKLLELFSLYSDKVAQQTLEPRFMSSSELEEEQAAQQLLQELTAPKDQARLIPVRKFTELTE